MLCRQGFSRKVVFTISVVLAGWSLIRPSLAQHLDSDTPSSTPILDASVSPSSGGNTNIPAGWSWEILLLGLLLLFVFMSFVAFWTRTFRSNANSLLRTRSSPGRTFVIKHVGVAGTIGIGMLIFVWLVQHYAGHREALEFSIALLNGFLAAWSVFVFLVWVDEYKLWRVSVQDHREKLLQHTPFDLLLKRQLDMHWQLSHVFRKLVEHYTKAPGGALVIPADPDTYIDYLSACVTNASQSFEAVLRGGKEELYKPSSFFKNALGDWVVNGAGEKIMFPPYKRYFRRIEDAKCHVKRRIWIFKKATLLKEFEDKQIRNHFLAVVASKNVKNYWLDAEEVDALLEKSEYQNFVSPWNHYFDHDFAIIDSLAIKFTSQNGHLLFVSIAEQVAPYKKFFDDLDLYLRADMAAKFAYYKVDAKGINYQGVKRSWDDWQETCSNKTPIAPALVSVAGNSSQTGPDAVISAPSTESEASPRESIETLSPPPGNNPMPGRPIDSQ